MLGMVDVVLQARVDEGVHLRKQLHEVGDFGAAVWRLHGHLQDVRLPQRVAGLVPPVPPAIPLDDEVLTLSEVD